jgi:hypothetical protein
MERAILEAISGYEDRFNGTRHYPDGSTADVHLDVTRVMVADAIFRADLPGRPTRAQLGGMHRGFRSLIRKGFVVVEDDWPSAVYVTEEGWKVLDG